MKKIYIGYPIDEPTKWFHFASDGTRKDLEKEFADIYHKETGERLSSSEAEVYSLSEAYDYTEKKNYKIKLV